MNWVQTFLSWGLIVACVGFVQADSSPGTSRTAERRGAKRPAVGNVILDADGSLRGVVISLQGIPLSDTLVLIQRADGKGKVLRTATDAFGCFSVKGLSEGTYRLKAGRIVRRIRTWVGPVAPPRAGQLALLVLGHGAVYGHGVVRESLTADSAVRTAARQR